MYKFLKNAHYFLYSIWFLLAPAFAQSTTAAELNIPPNIALSNGLDLPKLSTCMYGLGSQNCNNTHACITNYLAKNQQCSQALPLYQRLYMLPVNGKVYSNVAVLELSNKNFVMIDNAGRVILPISSLDIQNAPGFLDLKTHYPAAQLAPTIQNFPIAVYLSETSNQLLFLQDIVDASCKTDCKPVGVAKVLYGFALSGDFIDANILRIMPSASNAAEE